MSAKFAGAKENILHGQSIRYLLLDEVWLYEQGVVEKAKARTTAFGNNKKILLSSQPGIEGDQLDQENKGLVFNWGWRCPDCNNLQQWYWTKEKEDGSWAGIIWEKNVDEEGNVNVELTGQSAKLQCYHCSSSFEDTECNRRMLNDGGEYILTEDHGSHAVKTYSWPAFVNQKISFC